MVESHREFISKELHSTLVYMMSSCSVKCSLSWFHTSITWPQQAAGTLPKWYRTDRLKLRRMQGPLPCSTPARTPSLHQNACYAPTQNAQRQSKGRIGAQCDGPPRRAVSLKPGPACPAGPGHWPISGQGRGPGCAFSRCPSPRGELGLLRLVDCDLSTRAPTWK